MLRCLPALVPAATAWCEPGASHQDGAHLGASLWEVMVLLLASRIGVMLPRPPLAGV